MYIIQKGPVNQLESFEKPLFLGDFIYYNEPISLKISFPK
jgi:hypothetical protein